jgi:hypothetical protein
MIGAGSTLTTCIPAPEVLAPKYTSNQRTRKHKRSVSENKVLRVLTPGQDLIFLSAVLAARRSAQSSPPSPQSLSRPLALLDS